MVADPPPEWNFIPDPRSKSQSLTGEYLLVSTQRMLSGLRSLWAIPLEWRNSSADARSSIMKAASCSVKVFLSFI